MVRESQELFKNFLTFFDLRYFFVKSSASKHKKNRTNNVRPK